MIVAQTVFLSLTILSCIGIQFCNYQGYKFLARSLFGMSTKQVSDRWFRREEGAVYGSLILFVLGLLCSLVVFLVYT